MRGPASATVRLLDYEPALAASVRPERLEEVRATATATLVRVGRGAWTAAELADGDGTPYGALVLDGLANRTVTLEGVVSARLVGPGDLVRADDDRGVLLASSTSWHVIEPLALALLDARFLLSVRRWPELVAALFERLSAQDHRRELHRALLQLPRVEDRVQALMWLLAERWGRVTARGMLLSMRLTHALIGELVGAKRPTVSLALRRLEAEGRIRRRADGWLLAPMAGCEPHAEQAAGGAAA